MTGAERFTDPDGRFDVLLPRGWTAEADPEEGGVEFSDANGVGTLHLISFEEPEDHFPDPAEELYAFLGEQGVELQEEEVEDVPLEGDAELALCEYVSGDEEEGESYWLVGVATAPGVLVFATYLCPAGEEDAERDTVLATLASLRLSPGT